MQTLQTHMTAVKRNSLAVIERIILGMPVDLADLASREDDSERTLLSLLHGFLLLIYRERDPKRTLLAARNDLRAAENEWRAAEDDWRDSMVSMQVIAGHMRGPGPTLQDTIERIPLADLVDLSNMACCKGNPEQAPLTAIEQALLVATHQHTLATHQHILANHQHIAAAATRGDLHMASREGNSEEASLDMFEFLVKLFSVPPRFFVDIICMTVQTGILEFVSVHSLIVRGEKDDKMRAVAERFLLCLDGTIARSGKNWLQVSCFMGIVTTCSLLEYEEESNVLMRAMAQGSDETDVAMDGSSIQVTPPSKSFMQALDFAVKMYDVVVRRWGDTNTLPFVHIILVFVGKMILYPAGISHLVKSFPWKLTMGMLNYHMEHCGFEPSMDNFPSPEKGERPRPLPEDYAMCGVPFAADYHPKDWFDNGKIDENEKYSELAPMTNQRKERILYLGNQIAAHDKWLTFDTNSKKFGVIPAR